MRTHIVKQGEFLSQIARHYGFADWRLIYNHPANDAFRKKRPNPNVLHPGDEIAIPTEDKTVECATGRTHSFVVKRPSPDRLVLILKKHGVPIEPQQCTVEFLDSAGAVSGTTLTSVSSSGEINVPIANGAPRARITTSREPKTRWVTSIGSLDPIRDHHTPFDEMHCKITGVQARLNNLGFKCGEVDGILGPRSKAAIESFQAIVLGREDADGTLDEETCDRLATEHGC